MYQYFVGEIQFTNCISKTLLHTAAFQW